MATKAHLKQDRRLIKHREVRTNARLRLADQVRYPLRLTGPVRPSLNHRYSNPQNTSQHQRNACAGQAIETQAREGHDTLASPGMHGM